MESLSLGQHEAIIDWLHWGGQLIVVGGAGSSLQPLLAGPLGPYVPAVPSGKNDSLTTAYSPV